MTQDSRRITLISRNGRTTLRNWDMSANAVSRVIAVDSLLVLRYALAGGLAEVNRDVERVVLDRTTSASEYLALLASLPAQFAGDVLLVTNDDSGFLSALGRGVDRVLYALSAPDVRFYLETHGLVTGHAAAAELSPVLPMFRNFAKRASA